MNLFEMAQALAPFTLLCLFVFFWRMRRMENSLLILARRTQQQNEVLAKAVEQLQQKLAVKESAETAPEKTEKEEPAV